MPIWITSFKLFLQVVCLTLYEDIVEMLQIIVEINFMLNLRKQQRNNDLLFYIIIFPFASGNAKNVLWSS